MTNSSHTPPELDASAGETEELARPRLSVVLPAYNEEACIEKAVRDTLAHLEAAHPGSEVLVVDDGSEDRTAELVTAIAKDHPSLRLLRHETNLGYGAAIWNGFRSAAGELLFFTDSDSQFDIREIDGLIETVQRESADAVFGFRVYRYDSVLRCFLSWVYNRLVRILFRVRVRDVDCAFKLFRRELVERMDIESTDFFVDTELVAQAARLGARTVEVGVRHYPRTAGRTTVRASHVPRTLATVARMWWRLHFGRRRRRAEDWRSNVSTEDAVSSRS